MDIPKNYSLAKEHADHFELHDSNDGKRFKVAKKGLHPGHQIKIMKLQKLSDGDGGVEPEAEDANPVEATQAAPATENTEAPPQWTPPMLSPEQVAQGPAPVLTQPQAAPAGEIPIAGKAPPPDAMQQLQANQSMQEKGLTNAGNAQVSMGQEQAKAYQASNEALKNVLANYQAKSSLIDKQVDEASKAVANTEVDPQRFMHNMSTGHRVMAGIALALGALGAAYTKGPNYAYETIQRAINNDVEAQKADLGKKQTLLSMNLQKYGNLNAATHATLMQMNAMTQGQVAQTAAKYGGTINQGNTQMLLGQLKNKNMQDSMGMKSMMLEQDMKQHLATGDVSGQNPLDFVKFVVPPAQQKEVATEIGKAQYTNANEQKLLNLFDQASKEQTVIRTTGRLFSDSPALKSLRNMAIPLIHDQEGRVSEFELKTLEDVLPHAGQKDSTQVELRNGFKQFLENKKEAPLAKTHGIDINKFNSTKDLEESQIQTHNGVKYQKVQGGWQRIK